MSAFKLCWCFFEEIVALFSVGGFQLLPTHKILNELRVDLFLLLLRYVRGGLVAKTPFQIIS
jgi:hypothetical protein